MNPAQFVDAAEYLILRECRVEGVPRVEIASMFRPHRCQTRSNPLAPIEGDKVVEKANRATTGTMQRIRRNELTI